MQLYARITNPLVVKDRAELVKKISEFSVEYAELYNRSKKIDEEYSKKHEDAIKAFNDFVIQNSQSPNRKSRQELYEDPEFIKVFEAEDNIVDEWQEVNRENDLKAKSALTKALRDNDFDGVILENDVGSFGRSTEAYIALDNTQVKSATSNIGTFDKTEGDIRYSIPRNARNLSHTEIFDLVEKGEMTSEEGFEVLREKYGTMKPGEKQKVDAKFPEKISKLKDVSQYARTVAESGHLDDGMSDRQRREILKGGMTYQVISDKSAMKKADNAVMTDFEGAVRKWQDIINSGKLMNKYDIALGEKTVQIYTAKCIWAT